MRTIDAVARQWVAIDQPGWQQAHASTVLATAGGALAAWFGGTREGTPDNKIWFARRARPSTGSGSGSGSGSGGWSQPEVLAEAEREGDPEGAHWNPVLCVGPDGAIWLFYKRGGQISQWVTWYRRSLDDGKTWTEAAELVPGDAGGRGPVKNPGLVLAGGTWLAPNSLEWWDSRSIWEPYIDRSVDGGAAWELLPIPLNREGFRGAGVIQPALWSREGEVFSLMRSTEGQAFRSCSSDGGRTWSPAQPVDLVNNNSGLAVVALPDGSVVCVHNPTSGDGADRCPLVVSRSTDDGISWTEMIMVEDGRTPLDDDPDHRPMLPGAVFTMADGGVETTGVGEYSYPSVVLDGEQILITYTWQRRGIVEAQVPLALLKNQCQSI